MKYSIHFESARKKKRTGKDKEQSSDPTLKGIDQKKYKKAVEVISEHPPPAEDTKTYGKKSAARKSRPASYSEKEETVGSPKMVRAPDSVIPPAEKEARASARVRKRLSAPTKPVVVESFEDKSGAEEVFMEAMDGLFHRPEPREDTKKLRTGSAANKSAKDSKPRDARVSTQPRVPVPEPQKTEDLVESKSEEKEDRVSFKAPAPSGARVSSKPPAPEPRLSYKPESEPEAKEARVSSKPPEPEPRISSEPASEPEAKEARVSSKPPEPEPRISSEPASEPEAKEARVSSKPPEPEPRVSSEPESEAAAEEARVSSKPPEPEPTPTPERESEPAPEPVPEQEQEPEAEAEEVRASSKAPEPAAEPEETDESSEPEVKTKSSEPPPMPSTPPEEEEDIEDIKTVPGTMKAPVVEKPVPRKRKSHAPIVALVIVGLLIVGAYVYMELTRQHTSSSSQKQVESPAQQVAAVAPQAKKAPTTTPEPKPKPEPQKLIRIGKTPPVPAEPQAAEPEPVEAPKEAAAAPPVEEQSPIPPQEADGSYRYETTFPGWYPENEYLWSSMNPKKLKVIIAELRKCKGNIELVGHTDSAERRRPKMVTSQKRADAVRDKLVKVGKFDRDKIVTSGVGDTNPKKTNTTERGRLANRRVTIRCD